MSQTREHRKVRKAARYAFEKFNEKQATRNAGGVVAPNKWAIRWVVFQFWAWRVIVPAVLAALLVIGLLALHGCGTVTEEAGDVAGDPKSDGGSGGAVAARPDAGRGVAGDLHGAAADAAVVGGAPPCDLGALATLTESNRLDLAACPVRAPDGTVCVSCTLVEGSTSHLLGGCSPLEGFTCSTDCNCAAAAR